MIDLHFEEIRRLPLFARMGHDTFDALVRGVYLQTFPPQIQLITEGDTSDFLHVLLSGSVELFSVWNGRETVMATVRPVSSFILAASIKNAPYLMSARTLEKSRVFLIPSQDVRRAFASDPRFAHAIVDELALHYRASVKTAKNLKLRSSFERLANYLLRQQRRSGGAKQFDLPGEKRRIASYLGMTPENLSRALNGLSDYGVLVDGNRITITNQADLQEFANPDPLIDDFSV